MHGYSQPADYRFSHDSIELAQRVVFDERELSSRSPRVGMRRALDLCAGCGVVGLEFARLLRTSVAIDFNEIQSVYQPHFDLNVEWIKNSFQVASLNRPVQEIELRTRWLEMNYEALRVDEFAAQYDVVFSNPPYFDHSQGKLPPSEFKARCRFFLDSDFATLLEVIRYVLKPGGISYVLVRGLEDHGVAREEILNRVWSAHGTWIWLPPIRGTGLVKFTRFHEPETSMRSS